LSFVARPLRDFPEVFGITEDVKGYFPHHFNTPENQNYIGPIPDKHFYGPENMNPKVNKALNEWYDKQGDIGSEAFFNFKEEMIKYCRSDVEVLARGVLRFRQIFYSKFDVDPFRYITISSLCMNIYKAKFMPKNTIVSNDLNKPISRISREYFIYLNNPNILREHPLPIRLGGLKYEVHRNKIAFDEGHEYETYYSGTTAKFVVDGLDKKNKIVYEFNGCRFHGCRKCYPNEVGVYNRTMEKLNILEAAGYKVVSISECDWNKKKAKMTPDARHAIENKHPTNI
jgi:hypothetical protein